MFNLESVNRKYVFIFAAIMAFSYSCRKKIIHPVGEEVVIIDEGNPVWVKVTPDDLQNIERLQVFNGKLYFAGNFQSNNGTINYLASLDNNDSIHPVTSFGVSNWGSVNDLNVYNGELIIAGQYELAGFNEKNLFRMDASENMTAIDFTNNLSDVIYDTESFGNDLVVVGEFNSGANSSIFTQNVELLQNYQCSGTFVHVGVVQDPVDPMYCAETFNNQIYVGGKQRYLITWNGSQWLSQDYPENYVTSNEIYSLEEHDGDLIIAGNVGGSDVKIIYDNGTDYSLPPITIPSVVIPESKYLKSINGELFAFGSQFSPNNWNTGHLMSGGYSQEYFWMDRGLNINENIYDMIEFNGNVYVATSSGLYILK